MSSLTNVRLRRRRQSHGRILLILLVLVILVILLILLLPLNSQLLDFWTPATQQSIMFCAQLMTIVMSLL